MVQTELVKEVVVKNENTDDPLLKQVGKRRVREVENAEDSASPSSMTRQYPESQSPSAYYSRLSTGHTLCPFIL